MSTRIIDQLFLELSQFTRVKTDKEQTLEDQLWECYHAIKHTNPDYAAALRANLVKSEMMNKKDRP